MGSALKTKLSEFGDNIRKLELKTCIVSVDRLLPHEQVVQGKVEAVKRLILGSGYVKFPILVDLNTFTVLDGHHRLEAVKALGLKMIPVFFVDYFKDYVLVKSFRKEFLVTKGLVIEAARARKLLPPKTSRHLLKGVTIPSSFIPISVLSVRNEMYCRPFFYLS